MKLGAQLSPELTSKAQNGMFGLTRVMKNATKNGKHTSNGGSLTRRELIAAHQRALKRTKKMTAREGFQSLVTAGIITSAGKLSPRYGG